jgi:hypothetical protein
MKLLRVSLCALVFGVGCASEGEWDEFWKDLRGDNMKMRNDFSGTRRGEGQPASVKTDAPEKTDAKADD